MATIGDQLITPETGWKRYDDNVVGFKYIGSGWKLGTSSNGSVNEYSQTQHFTNVVGDKVVFEFSGTKLRVIAQRNTNRSTVVDIVLDGVTYTYSENGSLQSQTLLFEKTDLPSGVHTVEIKHGTGGSQYISLDAIDIDDTGSIKLPLGVQLTSPEPGWKRYDDSLPQFVHTGTGWTAAANNKYTTDIAATIKFAFIGTKIRFIHRTYSNHRSTVVTIDGVSETYTTAQYGDKTQILAYEKTGLENKRHEVIISFLNDNTYSNNFDFIDIDETGSLEFMSKVGDQLTAPETGWKRYDDTSIEFMYTSNLVTTAVAEAYNGSARYVGSADAATSVSFKFKGTKMRILSAVSSGYSQTPIKVMIDGVEYSYTEYNPTLKQQVLIFESPWLTDTVHEVVVIPPSGSPFQWDCIDINDTGYLVSKIGQQLTAPEAGWRRYDNTHPSIAYKGVWSGRTDYPGSYNLTDVYTSSNTATARFGFVGTKIRLISFCYSNFTADAKITIDGVPFLFSEYSAALLSQIVVFEKGGLSNGYHIVEIKLNSGSAILGIDAIDIDNTGYLTSERGVQLKTPDAGWKRYDETGVIKFNGTWSPLRNSGYYSGEQKYTSLIGSSYEFQFKGTQVRIIGTYHNTYSDLAEVSVDGVIETFSAKHPSASTGFDQALLYEKTDLEDKLHTVKVTNKRAIQFSVDAIDINSEGRIFHPDEVFDIKDLQVGKRIRVNYKTSSGVVGTISQLGKETKDFIPAISAAAPDGDFYFIMVETGRKKILIPDRNLQHTIPWDTLNLAGVASGSGILLKYPSVPKMTGPSSPSVSVSASSEFDNTTYQAWRAFDESGSTYWTTKAETATTEAILNITYALPQAINSYYLYAIYSPKKWVLEASNDNTHWTVLHTGNEPTSWHSGGQRTFSFANTTAYKYYRIRVTERHEWNGFYYTGFYTLQLFSTIPDSKAILRLLTGGTISTDKDNEWDQYIVNGTGNGTYSPGDNTVWNWKDLSSATSTTSGAPGSRTTRGNTAAGAFSSTASNQGVAFRPVLVIEPLFSSSYLISDGHSVKTYKSESGWETVGSLPVTDSMFEDYGMTDLNKFVPFLKGLANTSKIDVLCCTAKESPSPNDVTITGVPLPQIVTMKDDLTFHHITHIDSVTLTADEANNGAIRLAISVNGGETWEALDSTNNWSTVDITSRSHFKTNGMTIEQFNSVSDWTSKLSASKKLRIAYYLELQSSSDIASITSLSLQIDLPNSWDKAIHGTDYHYGYTDTTNLRVRFMSDGDFKINVGSGSGASTITEVDGGTFL
ncbi:discoidin domain-containing protein [Brevibacillus reuszeri]|uniref:discoidin domain-containing protein n=1 Tax=Brevibacillus reuszeri TaxID=54915 RepID=UPI002898F84B|nr:discoidin domain-containing protein [Brevibacillus reuszeri]